MEVVEAVGYRRAQVARRHVPAQTEIVQQQHGGQGARCGAVVPVDAGAPARIGAHKLAEGVGVVRREGRKVRRPQVAISRVHALFVVRVYHQGGEGGETVCKRQHR